MKYSPGFRASIVRKTQDGSGRSVSQIARETGISYTTITNWIKRYETGRVSSDGAEGLPPHQRNPGEKLALLLESKSLSEEEKGEWLRQHGLHGEHLRLWEQELITVMNSRQSEMNEAYAAVKKENKRLVRELKRKDKALADAAVLLTLKKKYRDLFAEEGEER